MQLSNIVINKELQEKWVFETDAKLAIFLPNPFAIVATKVAYNNCEDWMNQVNEYIDENIKYVEDFVNEYMPKVKMIKSQGTYLVWLDFRGYELDAKQLEDIMLNKAKVLLDEGYIFGEEGAGFERINVASPRSIIEECMNRIRSAFEGL